ncbi:hypothetical protein [Streptomyces yatensis]|uniref:DUF1453 domain-containing protein n=1 Tax=Streptomyces yatensis TaxID=155177 RepID=A0ABP4U2C5_9ACTN|nr:hypothetical protein [Streptomyces yatensis]
MDINDWLIDIALVGIVLLQLRGRRLTAKALLLPVALVAWAATKYLHEIPTSGNDLVLIVATTLIGLALGAGAGMLTRVYHNDAGEVIARATAMAAVLWVVGCGFRMAFQLFATQGGDEAIGRFSTDYHLDPTAWAPAILLMALAEVIARTAIVAWRAREVLLGASDRGRLGVR